MKMLASLANLTTLHLNYEQFSDDLLQMFCQSNRTPLNVLHLIIANVDRSHPGTTNELWSKFVYVNPSCRLEIDVICNEEAVALLDSHILQPAMPLSKFSTYFCEKVNEPALEFLSQWYNGTLNCLNIVDSLNVDEVPPLLVEDHFGRVDPLIMIAWKCHSLESLTLIGYEYSDIGLIGIARLCGPKLLHFDIPELCIDYQLVNMSSTILSKSVGEALKRKWRPMETERLDTAILESEDAWDSWDSYVLNRLNSS